MACAAALATIALIEDGLVENAAEMGGYLADKLNRLKSNQPAIADVRGLGLMIGVELGREGEGLATSTALRDQVMQKCFENGLLLLSCGESTLRFCPPLIVTRAECDEAVDIFARVLSELSA